jgi:hypothetical protein
MKLNDREYDLIAKERPEYYIQYQEPSIDKLWPQRDRLKSACLFNIIILKKWMDIHLKAFSLKILTQLTL